MEIRSGAFLGIVALLALSPLRSWTAETAGSRLEVTAEPREVGVGDRLSLIIRFFYPADAIPAEPPKPERLGPFEVLDVRTETPTQAADQGVQNIHYSLTTFDVGTSTIPPIAFTYERAGSNVSLQTPEMFITVRSVLTPESKDIRDIKPLIPGRFPWAHAAVIFLSAALAAAAVLFWRRKAGEKNLIEANVAPHEWALAELTHLEREAGLPPKVFYSRLTEILRRYLETGLQLPALDRTSQELLLELRNRFEARTYLELREILEISDLAKFAKQEPDAEERRRNLERVRQLVLDTKPAPPVPEPMLAKS